MAARRHALKTQRQLHVWLACVAGALAVAAVAGALLLVLATPPLRGLFAILAGSASAATAVGLWRMRWTIAEPGTQSPEPRAQSRS